MRKSLLYLLATAAFLLLSQVEGNTCTNVIVTPGASRDGSVLVSYAADSHYLYGELYYKPAADWKPGSMIPIYDWDTHRYLGERVSGHHHRDHLGRPFRAGGQEGRDRLRIAHLHRPAALPQRP